MKRAIRRVFPALVLASLVAAVACAVEVDDFAVLGRPLADSTSAVNACVEALRVSAMSPTR